MQEGEGVDVLARFNDLAAPQGLAFVQHHGFEGFHELPIDRGGYSIFQGFSSDVSKDGLWMACWQAGRPVATMAAMPMALGGTLVEHLETSGLYPTDRDRWEVYGEARDFLGQVTGFAVFSGGYLVDRALRGTETSRLILRLFPALGREMARQNWDATHLFSMVKGDAKGRRLVPHYSHEKTLTGVNWYRDGDLLDNARRIVGCMSGRFVRAQALRLLDDGS
jgi:hypothetical protein